MKKKSKLITLMWAAIILILSITPGNYIPPVEFDLIAPDTIAHFVFYFVLVCFMLTWKLNNSRDLSTFLSVLIITILYGFIIELIQGNLIPGRFYDVYDILFNSVGSVFGATSYMLYIRFKK